MPRDDDDDAGLDWLNAQLGDDEPENESGDDSDVADDAEAEADASDDSDEPEVVDVEAAAAAPAEPTAVIDAESDSESDSEPDSESDLEPEDTGDFVWDLKPTVPTGKRPAASVTPAEPEPVFIPEPARYSAPTAPTEPAEPSEPSEPLPPSELVEPQAPAEPELSVPAEPQAPAPRVVLEPEPWWTTPVQSPLVPTADEVAAASERPPEPVEPATDAQPIVPPPPAEAPMPLDAPGGFAPFSSAGAGRTPGRPASRGAAPKVARILGWTAAGLLAVGGLIALFVLGQQLVAGQAPVDAPATSAAASATPTPTPTAEATGPQPVGVHAWDALRGGECLEPYTSPWEETFTVVECDTPHGAELVYRGVFEGEADAAFPGEDALAAQINVLCSAPGVIDLDAAEAFPDLQVQGSYPVTEEQWTGGQRDYSCFVSRSSDEPLTASVAGPGPAA